MGSASSGTTTDWAGKEGEEEKHHCLPLHVPALMDSVCRGGTTDTASSPAESAFGCFYSWIRPGGTSVPPYPAVFLYGAALDDIQIIKALDLELGARETRK